MVSLMKTVLRASLVLLLCDNVDAFIPSSKHSGKLPFASASLKRQGILSATVVEEEEDLETLTAQDEEILFGDESVPDSSRPSAGERQRDRFGNIRPGQAVDSTRKELDHASDPLINKLHTMRSTLKSCPDMWEELAQYCPEKRAIVDEHLCDDKIDLNFGGMYETVQRSAAVFASLGVKKGVNVAILGENSARWLMVDHGIQMAGGASAVRGADAPVDEIRYIYDHSESAGIVVLQGPKLLKRLAADASSRGEPGIGLKNEKYGPAKTVILMHREKKSEEEIAIMAKELDLEIVVFDDVLQQTAPLEKSARPALNRNDLATIVYTSGTTGNPKGVMLTHGNLLHQTEHRLGPSQPYEDSEALPGECMLALLPVWHITERTFELWMISRGCFVVYSSIRTFKPDLAKHRPQWLVLVPRVLEKVAMGVQDKFSSGSVAVKALSKLFTTTGNIKNKHLKIARGLVVGDEAPGPLEKIASRTIVTALAPINAVGNKLVWSKVQDGFGGRVKAIIAGGSALSGSLETFFETAGMTVAVAYGLTECSPLLAFRRTDENLVTAGCVGKACAETEIRVVDPESKADLAARPSLPTGEVGVILGRGPQVMKGYFRNKEATASAVDKFGWFDTGDLGRINPVTGDLVMTGRAKDTIVLSNGENIEPIPIEDAILGESDLVEQIMLTGQDGRKLTAIVVLTPSELASAGFLEDAEAKLLQEANEKINDPKCTPEDCQAELSLLQKASENLRKNTDLKKALAADAKKATQNFRTWEKVSDVYLTLEPFAMANGLLTQSYKVKRGPVAERYEGEL